MKKDVNYSCAIIKMMINNKKSKKSLFKFLLFGWFILSIFRKKEKKKRLSLKDVEHNFLNFAHKEEKELEELTHHKEGVVEYVEDSTSIFKDFFIPHSGNNHHPRILRKKSLIIISMLAVLLKVSLVSYLFFIYPNNAKMSEDLGSEVFQLLNEERVGAGLKPLNLNTALMSSATDKADDMITNNYFAHKSLDGRMPWDWVSRRNYPYLFIGENLGMNFSSAESVNQALMNSPSHKKNILNEKYTDVGVVVRKGAINGKETNVLVQLFGSQKKEELIPNPALNQLAVISKEDEIKSTEKDNEKEKVLVKETSDISVENDSTSVMGIENVEITKESENLKENDKHLIIPEKIASISKENINVLKSKIEKDFNKNEQVSSSSALLLGDKAKAYIEKETPKPNLGDSLNKKIEFISNINTDDKYTVATRISDYFNIFLLALLALMSIALLANIFIKLQIQHKPAIAQTLLLLILLFGLYSVKLHFIENLPSYITIF